MVRYYFVGPTSFDEKKTTFIFVNTLSKPYYEMMIGNAMQNFAKIVWSEELIEHGIKNKKIEGKFILASSAKKSTPAKKKEGDTHIIFVNQPLKGQASYIG